MRTCLAFGWAGRAGVSKGSTLTAFPDPMPWRRFAPCVGRCLMPACSGEQIVYPLSALISEPWHGQADGAHVGASGGPPQRAATCGAWFVRAMLGAPIREGGSNSGRIIWGWIWNIALATCKARWQAVRHDATSKPGARMSRSSRRNCLLMAMVKLPNRWFCYW